MPAFFLLGLFSLLTQVFALKELSGLLTAHEAALGLGLSAWLLWTAAGMALALKNPALTRALEGPKGFLSACVFFTFASGANLILLKKAGFLLTPGLAAGLLELILYSFLLTLPAALAGGMCLARGLSEKRLAFYRAESFGAAAGGLLTLLHAVFFPGTDPLFILGAAALALIFSAPGVSLAGGRKLAPAALAGLLFFGGTRLKPPFALPDYFAGASAYARTTGSRMAFMDTGGQKTFIEDGSVLIQTPLTEQSEISVQLPMLAHKNPENILFIGPAGLLLASEAQKHHPKSVTVCDPDRFRAAFILERSHPGLTDAQIDRTDARLLLGSRQKTYDMIFQTVPEPLNAAANRYFTLDFFREAGRSLKKDGILVFTLPFSENYLPPERAYFAASILASAASAFKYLELTPGGTLTALASDSPIDLAPEALARRYGQRKIKNLYATPYAFPFLLDPYRRSWAATTLGRIKHPPLNTDLNPVAYFYVWKMWLAMFVSPGTLTGLALMAAAFALLLGRLPQPAELLKNKEAAGVFLAGFWAMGFEVVCLFMFQTSSGQLTWKMGMLFAGFMAGLAAGGRVLKNFPSASARAGALILGLALTAGLYAFCPRLASLSPAAAFPIFMALLFCGGAVLGGYFAASAGRDDGGVAGLYYSDLLGAALGAFIFSAAIIPLAGLRASLIWAAAALAAGAALALYSLKESTVKM